jgi:hypothetical protein
MDDVPTIRELEHRWQRALELTRTAVGQHPECYRKLKRRAAKIVTHPLDIREYLPAAEEVACLLKTLDPAEKGTIFCFFRKRIEPSSISKVPLLRVECGDLLAYLKVFDEWRKEDSRLTVIK